MKLRITLLFLTGFASSVFAQETAKTSDSNNVSTRIVDGIHYAPVSREHTPVLVKEPEKTNEDSILMSNFTVNGAPGEKNLVQSFQEKEQTVKAEKFSNATGGYLVRNDVGPVRKEVGVWPASSSSGYDLVHLAW